MYTAFVSASRLRHCPSTVTMEMHIPVRMHGWFPGAVTKFDDELCALEVAFHCSARIVVDRLKRAEGRIVTAKDAYTLAVGAGWHAYRALRASAVSVAEASAVLSPNTMGYVTATVRRTRWPEIGLGLLLGDTASKELGAMIMSLTKW